ncbi:hypothetical protein MKX08_004094 [Trichoderma sp. CBMAI-0020]|nr:hypothetical protein MKX08_004094 [Trichoderma sp. CBMAI-0020]
MEADVISNLHRPDYSVSVYRETHRNPSSVLYHDFDIGMDPILGESQSLAVLLTLIASFSPHFSSPVRINKTKLE